MFVYLIILSTFLIKISVECLREPVATSASRNILRQRVLRGCCLLHEQQLPFASFFETSEDSLSQKKEHCKNYFPMYFNAFYEF